MIDRATLDEVVTEQALQFRAALQEANDQLQRANLQLENRVRERTAELQHALEQLSEVNKLKSNIVANISHELRTPLTHIQGYLELLGEGDLGDLNSDQGNAVNVMKKAADRLHRLIEDLIMYSVSEKDQIFLQIRPTNINTICEQCLSRSQTKAGENNVNLKLEVASQIPDVEADPSKISWVIMQLLDNAIKFSPQYGVVTLVSSLDGNFVNIAISDNGIGIPPTRMGELFEPFHQLDGSSTRKYGGTGLGLALVKRIVEAHGSVIRVSSEEGKGSRFEFLLKAYPKQKL